MTDQEANLSTAAVLRQLADRIAAGQDIAICAFGHVENKPHFLLHAGGNDMLPMMGMLPLAQHHLLTAFLAVSPAGPADRGPRLVP